MSEPNISTIKAWLKRGLIVKARCFVIRQGRPPTCTWETRQIFAVKIECGMLYGRDHLHRWHRLHTVRRAEILRDGPGTWLTFEESFSADP